MAVRPKIWLMQRPHRAVEVLTTDRFEAFGSDGCIPRPRPGYPGVPGLSAHRGRPVA